MHLLATAKVLAIIVVANGAPVLARRFLGDRCAWPLDGGLTLPGGQRLLGASKTVRGVVLALLAGVLTAPLLGLDARLGAEIAACAMVGDLLSSFCKRRLGMPSSSRAIGLDQVPESLLPMLWGAHRLDLGVSDIAAGVVAFVVGELVLSPVLFRLRIREQPH